MSPRITRATARRVLTQLRRDSRTVALLLVVPPLLVALLKFTSDGEPQAFARIGGPLVGLFPFITMFLVISITMLRERTTGTLERLMTMPLAKLDLLLGYGVAFFGVAIVQAVLTAGVGFGALGLESEGSTRCSSSSSRSPTRSSGPRSASSRARSPGRVPGDPVPAGVRLPAADPLRPVRGARADGRCPAHSDVLPLTYAFAALQRATVRGSLGRHGALDVAVVVGATLLALALGAATLRRRTP